MDSDYRYSVRLNSATIGTHVGTNCNNLSNALMTADERVLWLDRPVPLLSMKIRVAYLYADESNEYSATAT